VKWLLYPDEMEEEIDIIDHKLESLAFKGKFPAITYKN